MLSELKYFDVTSGSLMPDVMHDVLEGVLQFEAKLLLRQFIHHDHYFALAQLNQQSEALELGFSEVINRPTPISHATLQEGDNHLKQSGKWLASHFCSCSIDNVQTPPSRRIRVWRTSPEILGLLTQHYQKSGEPIRLLILADHVVRNALPKRTLESCN